MTLVAGVDSSTQSTKVELRELDSGRVVAVGRAAHPPTTPPISEQDPDSWWVALQEAFAMVGNAAAAVEAISIGGQQHGLVVLDQTGSSIRPAKLWNDTTSSSQSERLIEEHGAPTWADATGSLPVAAFTITKLAWLAEHEPDRFDRVAKVMLPHDYLTWRLTGVHTTDRGDASGTGWWSPSAGEYRLDLLERATGVTADRWADRLPTVLGPNEQAGRVTPEAAASLGLVDDVAVGPGSGDNMAAALGLGLRPGDLVVSLGTSGTAYAVSESATADPAGLVAGFADATGRFLPLVCTLNATKVTDTIAGWLGMSADEFAEAALSDAAQPNDAADPPVVVPYFDGERTPNLPNASGLLSGVRNDTTREQLARAAHIGVLCGLLDGVDALRELGVATTGRLHLIGGGSRSAAYRQLTADLWGHEIVVPDDDEVVATGACVQAAAVLSGSPLEDVAARWGLGAGTTTAPLMTDDERVAIRSAHARAVGAASDLSGR